MNSSDDELPEIPGTRFPWMKDADDIEAGPSNRYDRYDYDSFYPLIKYLLITVPSTLFLRMSYQTFLFLMNKAHQWMNGRLEQEKGID